MRNNFFYSTKTLILTLIFLFTQNLGRSQSLTINDLQNLCTSKDFRNMSAILDSKKWEFYSSNVDADVQEIKWSFEMTTRDRASAWFLASLYQNTPQKITYQVSNQISYTKVTNGIKALGYTSYSTEIENDAVTEWYENQKFILGLNVTKIEKSDGLYTRKSAPAYFITLISKYGYFDDMNGIKTEYWPNGNVSTSVTLKAGMLEGLRRDYFENGQLEFSGSYKNGKMHGSFTKYDVNDNKIEEYIMAEDVLNGKYVRSEYDNNNNNLSIRYQGRYKNNLREGTWITLFFEDTVADTIEYKNYKEDVKHGYFKEYLSLDSLEEGYFVNGLKDGLFKLQKLDTMYVGPDYETYQIWRLNSQGNYKNDKKDGLWKYYNLGQVSDEVYYKNGVEDGQWVKYALFTPYEGQISSKENYVNGVKHGVYEQFFEMKQDESDTTEKIIFRLHPMYVKVKYVNGKKEGPYIKKDTVDNIHVEGEYKSGLRVGTWKAQKDGKGDDYLITTKYDTNGSLTQQVTVSEGEFRFEEHFSHNNRLDSAIFTAQEAVKSHFISYHTESSYGTQQSCNVKEIYSISPGLVLTTNYTVTDCDEYDFLSLTNSGISNGLSTTVMNNDTIISGNYKNGIKEGVWSHVDTLSDVICKQTYMQGQIITEGFALNGNNKRYTGTFTMPSYDEEEIISVKKGKRHGTTIIKNNNGDIIKISNFNRGVEIQKQLPPPSEQ